MTNSHGNFVWYELMTSDADAAQDFYGAVLDWKFETRSDMDYRMVSANNVDSSKGGVAGFMPISTEMAAKGAQPCWLGYIGVDDVDAAAKSITEAGGVVHAQPWEIPGVGRMAMVADPQGACLYIMRGSSDEKSNAFADTDPLLGHCAWNELTSDDPAGAISFYTGQFGWKQEGDMDMGPMGKYQFFQHGPGMIGAVMPKPDVMPVSAWTYYFRVADIDKAADAIKANGGKVVNDATEIPGGEFQLNGQDPQGAFFALVGNRG